MKRAVGAVMPGMGRSSTFSQAIADAICERIATGEPLRVICRDEGMPAFQRVYEHMASDEDFAGRFARARQIGFDAIAEEALEIANTPCEGLDVEEDADGTVVKRRRADALGHRKLQVETRLKLLAKWDPKRYGERVATELSGPNGGPIELSETERSARVAGLLALAQHRAAHDADGLT